MIKGKNKNVTQIIRYNGTSGSLIPVIKVCRKNIQIWPETQNPPVSDVTIFSNNTNIHSIEDIDNATKNISLSYGHAITGSYPRVLYFRIDNMHIDTIIKAITITVSCHSATGYINNIYCSFYNYDTQERLYHFDIETNVYVNKNFRWVTFNLPEDVDITNVSRPVIAVSFKTTIESSFSYFSTVLAGFGSNEQVEFSMTNDDYSLTIVHEETCPDIQTQYPARSLYNSAYILAYTEYQEINTVSEQSLYISEKEININKIQDPSI